MVAVRHPVKFSAARLCVQVLHYTTGRKEAAVASEQNLQVKLTKAVKRAMFAQVVTSNQGVILWN